MRILLVTPFLPPKIGGIERHSENFVAEFSKESKNRITVLTSRGLNDFERNDYPSNVNVITLASIILFGRLPIPIPTYGNVKKFARLAKMDFNRLLIQSHLFPISTLSAMVFTAIPTRIWINHSSGFIVVNQSVIQKIEMAYEKFQLAIMAKRVNRFIGVSEESANWASILTGKTFEFISNGVNSNLISPRSTFPTEFGKLRFVYVSRLIPGKGGIETLQIFKKLMGKLDRDYEIMLTVIGAGTELTLMEDFARNNHLPVTFVGAIEHQRVIELIKTADIFLYPSNYPEGLPTVILESIASGLLIATTVTAGLRLFILDSSIVQSSAEELPEKINDTLKNIPQLIAKIESSQKILSDRYTWDSIMSDFLK